MEEICPCNSAIFCCSVFLNNVLDLKSVLNIYQSDFFKMHQ